MRDGVKLLRGVVSAAVVAATATACAKTAAEESKVEIIRGSETEVSILAGVRGSPTPLAKAHCGQFQKQAVLRDVEPSGSQLEAWSTGSRGYIYDFDCF